MASGPMHLPPAAGSSGQRQQDTRLVQRKQKHAFAQSKIIINLYFLFYCQLTSKFITHNSLIKIKKKKLVTFLYKTYKICNKNEKKEEAASSRSPIASKLPFCSQSSNSRAPRRSTQGSYNKLYILSLSLAPAMLTLKGTYSIV